ncbi:MAG: cytochrome c family protein [Alphaproteobacteria bacterium]|nr:cytochrome c family protein [Alphaproteobacteria bacterium]
MDSLEVNKWIAAILVAGIAFMVTGFIGEILVHPRELAKPAIEIAGVPSEAGKAASAQAPKAPPILALLASADPGKGQQIAEQNCAICHSFNQGGQPKIGPNLYGVVGGPRAHEQGFDYTEGLKKLGGTWTYENLDQWLWDPHSVVPGTRMAFAGLKNNKERADVIAWLRSLSPNPQPLPTADQIKAEAEAEKPAAAPAAAAGEKPAQPAAPSGPSFDALLAKADPAKGKADAETNCTICHTFGKGEPAKIGPNLYGIVGAPRAHMAGFDYTAGLKKLGGTWTYDELNHWLTDPAAMVPGTRMIFPGIKSEKERADVVAYLRTLSDHPEPLPAAAGAGGQPATPAAANGSAAPAQQPVSPAREGTTGEQAAPAAGGTSQETPAEKASPGGAGTPAGEPQGGAAGAPAPALGKP